MNLLVFLHMEIMYTTSNIFFKKNWLHIILYTQKSACKPFYI